jgi:hypothetical protein
MSGFLFDTNCISELVRPKPEPRVVEWMEAADEAMLNLSVLTVGHRRATCGDGASPQPDCCVAQYNRLYEYASSSFKSVAGLNLNLGLGVERRSVAFHVSRIWHSARSRGLWHLIYSGFATDGERGVLLLSWTECH